MTQIYLLSDNSLVIEFINGDSGQDEKIVFRPDEALLIKKWLDNPTDEKLILEEAE